MDKRVKEIATQDAEKIKALTKDAVQSGAYLFPIKVQTTPSTCYNI